MKVKPSALVSSMSGSTADLTMASWKGILYARKKVIPANPQTAAQTLVREAFAACVTLWRSLHNHMKTWLDTYGVDYAQSGFNVFISKNRAVEQAGTALSPVPANPHIAAPTTFTVAAGGANELVLTWAGDPPAGCTHVYYAVRLGTDDFFEVVASDVIGASPLTVAVDESGEDYDSYVWYMNPTTLEHGTPAADLATASG